MSLDIQSLEFALSELFPAPPATAEACAAAWADAVLDYAGGVVPLSTTAAAAAAALESSLASAFASAAAAPLVDAAFATFAATLAAGMLPLYAGVPPAAPLGVATLLAAPVQTHEAAAAGFAALIDGWFRTGTATLVAPPNTPVGWS